MFESTESIEDLLLRYPGIAVAETHAAKMCLKGTIKIKEVWYCFRLSCPNFPKLLDMTLKLQQDHKIETFTTTSKNVQPEWNVFDLLENLPSLSIAASSDSKTVTQETILSAVAQERNIFKEITELYAPNCYRIQVDSMCTRIRFDKFAQHEQHYLELDLPALRIRSHSLPDCVPWPQLLQRCVTLSAWLQQFQKYLEELQPFYENFTEIDELCFVVQPAKPTTKDNWRLFLLRERVFLKLHIEDPFAPIASMSVHIIGPTTAVAQLRRVYSEGLSDWDAELDIHKNLLRIFDLCFFPMPPGSGTASVKESVAQQYCNICYCFQMEERGEIPIVSCDNPHCCLIFHAACLKEWFNTLADGKVFLDVDFGACPFCKAKLSTSFAELLKINI